MINVKKTSKNSNGKRCRKNSSKTYTYFQAFIVLEHSLIKIPKFIWQYF